MKSALLKKRKRVESFGRTKALRVKSSADSEDFTAVLVGLSE